MNATDLLANTLSPDANTRQDATQQLENASRENYPQYMLMLSAVLLDESNPLHVRNAAGLALKNALTARESSRQSEYSQRWIIVAAIAAVELPQDQWPELITILLGFVNNQPNTNLKIATLQTIGFICETIVRPMLLNPSSRLIQHLTETLKSSAYVPTTFNSSYPWRQEGGTSPDVQLAAIHSLFNSLEFVRDNFDRDGERNYIMQVVCEATQSGSVSVQVGAFEFCIMEKMGFYMEQALFGLTVVGMNHTDERVALQAVEFWSTVCEEEIELSLEAQESANSRHFARIALPEIIPVLLRLLTKQEEDADEDEWNVSMAAGTCLSLLSGAVQDAIVPAVLPFIEANITNQDWHHREAAVMAFGSVLEGPDPSVLTPLAEQALPTLISMMTDANTHVKDTTAWTLGRICELLINVIKPDMQLHPLISALVNGLSDSPRIVTNCAWALMNLADQFSVYYEEDTEATQSGPLSPYYEGVVQALLRVTESASNESNYRTAAYEAMTSYLTHATPDAIVVVQNTVVTILQRMEHLLGMHNQIVGVDDQNNWNELQSNICSVVICVVRKLGNGIQPLADRIMTLILQLIQAAGKTSTVLEDAFLVVGALASALESAFAPYISAFLQFLYPALKAHEDTQLCTVAVGIIGDISRALGEQSAQYAHSFMTVLLENLQSEVLNRNVKITILSCFGDIALAIGPNFEPFLDTTMSVLKQAGGLEVNPLDYDLVDYVAQLREGILEAYTGIVTGLKNTAKVDILLPYSNGILELIFHSLSDEERSESVIKLSCGLIGDLADCFPSGQLKAALLQPWVASELRARSRMNPETKKTMRWAREMVKVATQ
ncbi:karyopherin Kap95 [Hymenopellis radicata]|nr:karyopherin Kap95 [Hymenopellis radicata]